MFTQSFSSFDKHKPTSDYIQTPIPSSILCANSKQSSASHLQSQSPSFFNTQQYKGFSFGGKRFGICEMNKRTLSYCWKKVALSSLLGKVLTTKVSPEWQFFMGICTAAVITSLISKIFFDWAQAKRTRCEYNC